MTLGCNMVRASEVNEGLYSKHVHYCVMCSKPFLREGGPRIQGFNPHSLRPRAAKTCSKECAATLQRGKIRPQRAFLRAINGGPQWK